MASNRAPPIDQLFRWLLWLALIFLVFAVARLFASQMAHHALQPDWAWIARTGQWIIAHGALPATDIYSWTFPDRAWVLYQWAFEVVTAWLLRWMTPGQMALLTAVIYWGIYICAPVAINAHRRVPWLITAAVAALALIPAGMNLGWRPMLPSIAFFLLQYCLLQNMIERRLHPRLVALSLAPIYVLWANMHLAVALGLGSLALFALCDQLRSPSASPPCERNDRWRLRRRDWCGLLAVAAGASLVNPYGWNVYTYLWSLAKRDEMNALITELRPPDFAEPSLILGALLVVGFLLLLLRRHRRPPAYATAHILLLTAATAVSVRMMVWLALIYVLVVPEYLWKLIRDERIRFPLIFTTVGTAGRGALLAPLLLILFLLAVPVRPDSATSFGFNMCDGYATAIQELRAARLPEERWLTDDVGGSCSIWYAPAAHVFGDTRFDFYPGAFVVEWIGILQAKPGWRQALQRWNIRWILIDRGEPLAAALPGDTDYRRIYYDAYVSVWRRVP